MKILLIGNKHLKAAFEKWGHTVESVRGKKAEGLDIKVCNADLIIVHESLGMREFPYGLEHAPVPTIFYAVDTHLNLFWHKEYAKLFDIVFVSQKDFAERLCHWNAHWLPWSIDNEIIKDCSNPRSQDIVFIGTIDGQRVKRRNIILELSKRFSVHVYGADPGRRLSPKQMSYVYSSAKIVLNESIFGEVTFRTFEATACGAMLLTERVSNGLGELFIDGKEIVSYDRTDLFDKANYYLKNRREREEIAARGMQRTLQCYTTTRVAEKIIAIAQNYRRTEEVCQAKRSSILAHAKTLFFCGIKFPKYSMRRLKRAEMLLKAFCTENRNDSEARLYLGLTCFAQGKRQLACNMLESIAHFPEITHFYCMSALACGDVSAALAWTRRTSAGADITADNIMAHLALLYERHAMLFCPGSPSLDGMPLNAVQCHAQCGTARGLRRAAGLLCDAGAYGAALELFINAQQMQPMDAHMRFNMAHIYLKVYDTETAINIFAKSTGFKDIANIAGLQESEKQTICGIIEFNKGNYNGAIQYFLCAGTAAAYLRLARIYSLVGENHKALEFAQYALKIMPYDRDVRKVIKQIKERERAYTGVLLSHQAS